MNFSVKASTIFFLLILALDSKTILYASDRDWTTYPRVDSSSEESIVARVELIFVPKHAWITTLRSVLTDSITIVLSSGIILKSSSGIILLSIDNEPCFTLVLNNPTFCAVS